MSVAKMKALSQVVLDLGKLSRNTSVGLGSKHEWTSGKPVFNVTSASQKLAYWQTESVGHLVSRGNEWMILAMLV